MDDIFNVYKKKENPFSYKGFQMDSLYMNVLFIPFDAKNQFREKMPSKGIKSTVKFPGNVMKDLNDQESNDPDSKAYDKNQIASHYEDIINQSVEESLAPYLKSTQEHFTIQNCEEELGRVDVNSGVGVENILKKLEFTQYNILPSVIFLSEEHNLAEFPATFTVKGCKYYQCEKTTQQKGEQIIAVYLRGIELYLLNSGYYRTVQISTTSLDIMGGLEGNKKEQWMTVTKRVNGDSLTVAGVHLTATNTSITQKNSSKLTNRVIETMITNNINMIIGDLNFDPLFLKGEYTVPFRGEAGGFSGYALSSEQDSHETYGGIIKNEYSNSGGDKYYMGGCMINNGWFALTNNLNLEVGITGKRSIFNNLDDKKYYFSDHPPVSVTIYSLFDWKNTAKDQLQLYEKTDMQLD